MAATFNNDSGVEDQLFVSFPITKFEPDADGNLLVYGKATDETVDSDRQIVKGDWSGPALKEWLETGGNVRVMHNPTLMPAGKGLSVEVTPDGHFVKAKVVEPTAIKLVKEKVLQAYSVGISRPVVERDMTGKAQGGIIKGGEIFEVSLVDRPANKNCSITLSKSMDLVTKSADSSYADQWTYGDLEGQLVQRLISKSAGPQTASEWASKRAEWLAAEPNPADSTQGPEYLAKRAEWQRWHFDGETAGLVEDGYQTWLTKRAMDPDVGGGVDRDKIPAEDFAGKNRSFPIVTPGDVSDAASSIGQAGDDNYPSDKLKANIIRIAKRKGPSFVAELPKSWTEDTTKAKKPKKGGKPSFLIGANEGGSKTDEIPVSKGYSGSTCPVCGYDVKDGQCACCSAYPCTCDPGEMKDKATKKKKGKKKPFMRGEMADASLGEGGTTMKAGAGAAALTKCECPSCGADADDDDKFCSSCGTSMSSGSMSKKSLMPTRSKAKPAIQPAGDHREPDGDTSVEQLESDAGMSTKPDPVKDKVPASVDAKRKKTTKAESPHIAYSLKRMHDALCAAYHSDEVLAEYPSLKSVADAVDVSYFTDLAVKNASDPEAMAAYADLAASAELVKGEDGAVLADARAELHKSFTDMYPDTRLKPGAPPKPGSFTRPYISTGHASMTGTGKKPKMPAGGRQVNPNDYHRGALTAGHERPSPASKGNNPIGDVSTGSSRELYASASRQYAANRMKAIHDHIEMTTTGLCSMAPSNHVLPPDNGAGNAPAARSPLDTSSGAVVSTKSEDLEVFVAKVTKSITKAMKKKYESKLDALRAELDELGRKPDPTQAPVRGVVRTKAAGGAVPVDRRSLAIEAQDLAAKAEKAAYVNYLNGLANSGDPELREKAYKALTAEGVADPFAS